MLCLYEKSRNGEMGTLILCWNPVTSQNLHRSSQWCLVGHGSWPRSGGHSLTWDVLSGLSCSLQAIDATNCVVLGCSLAMVCNSHSGGNELLIYLPFPSFPQVLYLCYFLPSLIILSWYISRSLFWFPPITIRGVTSQRWWICTVYHASSFFFLRLLISFFVYLPVHATMK